MIDLRSDTLTKPTSAMLDYMMTAEVGDDVFGEDSSINALEEKAASLFGKESAVFCPSGTMTNQIALTVHTKPGDEVICDRYAHIYYYEAGGLAANAGLSPNLVDGDRGRLSLKQIKSAIKPDDQHFPKTTLLSLENTSNKGGGSIYSHISLEEISSFCLSMGLKRHLDGARIFNALNEVDYTALDVGRYFDSISVCLSKGLGAPVGSVLLGDEAFIYNARRVRKRFGGAMRQAGYLAAAGIFALDNHVLRLKDDHSNAKIISEILNKQSYTKAVYPVETNIVILQLNERLSGEEYVQKLESVGVRVLSLSPDSVRFVTHLDISTNMMNELEEKLSF